MKTVIPYAIIAALLVTVFRQCGRETVHTERYVDTLVVRDTVRDTVPVPHKIYIARSDTVFLQLPADTVVREVVVPVERKEYRTEHYHAVIEGFRPELVHMEVWPETRYVTRTEVNTLKKIPRMGLGIHAGYGFKGRGVSPYIGVGIHYNIVSF